MSVLQEKQFDAAGVSTRALVGGSDSHPVVVFLQSNVPGVTPYCGGSHLWGRVLDNFAAERKVVAVDGLGCGGTLAAAEHLPTIDAMTQHAIDAIKALRLQQVHLVAHDVAGLVALQIAIDQPSLLTSLTVVSSPWSAPSGDGVNNLTLSQSPRPFWSASSQAWAFERLSYSHLHIDDTLLKQATDCANGASHKAAVAAVAKGFKEAFDVSVHQAKSRFFKVGREQGLGMPFQVITAKQDPMVSVEHSLWLFKIVAQHQKDSQFHVINRAGTFPFREQPDEFFRIVAAFQDGVAESSSLAGA